MASILDKIQTIGDYQRSFDTQRQALDASKLDALSKKNIYATQVLSGAAATGDQNAYNAARDHLAQNGVDISTWAPDIGTGMKQATAARLAQSPLGSLLNAGLKEQSNAIQLNPQTGTISPTSMGQGGILGALGGQVAPTAPIVAKSWINPDMPQNPTPTIANSPLPAVVNDVPSPSAQYTTPVTKPQQSGGFVPPAQLPNEPVPTYRARVDEAFAQYKESPQAVRQKEAASNQGKNDVANIEASNKAQELTDRLTKNLQAMLNLNDSVPQSGFVPASAKAYLSRAFQANPALSNVGVDTSGNAATAYDQWNQINNQQVLSEIQQFVASGGANARVNQTLEKIAQAASSIHPEDSPTSRKAQIQNALAELQNKNISGQNLVKANQEQPTASYQDLPVTVPSKSEQIINNSGVNTIPPQKGEVRGGYLFIGGDPNDKNSYKKVGK